MKHLLARLGMVALWLGAVALGVGLMAAIGELTSPIGRPAAALFGFVPLALFLWSIAFVLGGSFWRPPRLHRAGGE